MGLLREGIQRTRLRAFKEAIDARPQLQEAHSPWKASLFVFELITEN
jgi:hypothetical protein